MIDATGTNNTAPSTPLVVPPLKSTYSGADPSGTLHNVPSDPLVVPPLSVPVHPVSYSLARTKTSARSGLAAIAVMGLIKLRSRAEDSSA